MNFSVSRSINTRFFLRNFALLVLLFVAACRQEIAGDGALPAVTSVVKITPTPVNTPVLSTLTPTITPTFAFIPAQTLPAGPLSLMTIGDDLTRGDGDDSGRGYPGRLLELIGQVRPGSSVTNFGQTGWTSDYVVRGDAEFMSQLNRGVSEVQTAVSLGYPTVALIWIGETDLWELYAGDAPVTPEQEEADVERFSKNVSLAVSELRKAGAEVIVAKLDDQAKRPAKTRGEIYPSITADELERMSLQVVKYNDEIGKWAEKYGALTVDFYGSEIFTSASTLSADGMHPNPAGYEKIAQLWYKALIPILP